MDLLNNSSRTAAKSIRACKLSISLFATVLVVLSGIIAVTGDMVPAAVFGWSIMLRGEGLQTCTRADLVSTHQFVTILATVKNYKTSS